MHRIAYISLMSGLPWGGSEAWWSTHALQDIENGHAVWVSVYDWGNDLSTKIKELQLKGAIIHLRQRFRHDVPFLQKVNRFLQNRISALDKTWDELIAFKPDEVYINQGSNVDLVVHHFPLYKLLTEHKIPYNLICHSHIQYSFIPESNIYPRGREVFQNARQVMFVSKRQKSLTERMLCTNLTNGVIFSNPPNLIHYNHLPYPINSTIQMAIVGALVSGKGHDTLFQVLSADVWKTRSWQLNIYGKGYGEQYLRDLAVYFGIQDKVCFCGHVASATHIWQQNHILLIPSDGEGLPISLVEAAISGRTAVVTDVGGNTEIIEDNVTGFVACAPTPHSFAEALERAWLRKDEWEQIGNELSKIISKQIEM